MDKSRQGETPSCGQIAVERGAPQTGLRARSRRRFRKSGREAARWSQRYYNPATKNNATVTMANAAQAGRLQSHTRRPLKETKMEKGRSTSKSASIRPAL